MTDVRKCDGPECVVVANIQMDSMFGMISKSPDSFSILERKGLIDLHFHNDRCLHNWTLVNTRK